LPDFYAAFTRLVDRLRHTRFQKEETMNRSTTSPKRRIQRLALAGLIAGSLIAPSAAQAEKPGPTEDQAGSIASEIPDVSTFSPPPGATVEVGDTNGVDSSVSTKDPVGAAIAFEVPGIWTFSPPPGATVQLDWRVRRLVAEAVAAAELAARDAAEKSARTDNFVGTGVASRVRDVSRFSLPPGATIAQAQDTSGVDFGGVALGAAAAGGGALLLAAAAYAVGRGRGRTGSLSRSHS
jgi:hypothetical protein